MFGQAQVSTYFQFARLFELLHVTLAFERAASGQEHILVVAIDVLYPVCKPGHGIVVYNGLPLSWSVGNRNWGLMSDINRNIFWAHAKLKYYLERVLRFELMITLSAPFFGCSPRPRKSPGGSTLKFPTFSFRPSRRHVMYLASTSSLAFFSSFFSAALRAFFLAFSAS